MIKLVDVTKTYSVKKRKKVALNNIGLEFPSKGFYTIVGSSGSGKSTLLNILGCLDKPTLGKMFINDVEITALPNKDLDYYRNTSIGFVFQNFNLIKEYTTYENISLSLELQNYQKDIIDSKVFDILEKLNLSSIEYKYPDQLSGGEKQRVAIARALIKNPRILLVDEPTGNLDRKNAELVSKILKEISKDVLVIMVTHDERIAKKYSDGIVKIENGKIISNGIAADDSYQNIELKKTKLSFKRILKLAFNNIRNRKLRFANMILLLTITFSFLFVAMHCFSYDKGVSSYRNFKANGLEQINLIKSKDYCQGEGLSKVCWEETSSATKNDVSELKSKYSSVQFNYLKATSIYISDDDDYKEDQPFYDNSIRGVAYVDDFANSGVTLLYGRYPETKDEVVISEYLAKMIIHFNYKNFEQVENVVGNQIPIDGFPSKIKIVGIYKDSHNQYNALENYEKNSYYLQLATSFKSACQNYYSIIYVREDFDFSHLLNNYESQEISLSRAAKKNNITILSSDWSQDEIIVMGNSSKLIGANEVILDVDTFAEVFRINKESIYENEHIVDDYLNENVWLEYNYDSLNKRTRKVSLKVVGVANHESGIYLDKSLFENVYEEAVISNMWMYSGVLMHFLNNDKQNIQLLNNLEEIGYKHNTVYSEAIYASSSLFVNMRIIFIFITIVLIFFSSLLVFNTIKSTIVDRMHDIGILKSLGATNGSICAIFLSESIFSWIIIIIFSTLCGCLTNTLINEIVGMSVSASITILYFNIWVCIGVMLISFILINFFCLFALKDIFSTKPIETINK